MTTTTKTTAKKTTAKKTTTPAVKKTRTTITKATLKARTAEKRRLGKTAAKANGKKMAAAMKKAGKGIFAPKKLSDALAAVCGKKTAPRTEVTKLVWAYIKKNKLNDGRTIKPDTKLKAIFPVASIDMLKMAGYIGKHLS
jgi:chromatin remodeling complex protein RSC6